MLKEIFFGTEKIFNRNVFFLHAALILISFLLIYFFSYTTSFRYPISAGDSAVFQVVGKYWAEGVIPYKELFDHKGPLIFFIDAIGWMICPRVGIMIPQIFCIYITFLFLWRMIEFHWQGRQKIFFFLLTIIFYRFFYSSNMTEEFNLPFIAMSAWCFMAVLKNSAEGQKFFLPPVFGFIYGLGCGASLLLRMTNAMPICCFVFLSAIFLFQERAFKNLRQNFLSFCAGFAIIVLPFVSYFAAHDALFDAVYGTLLFNIKYALNGSFHNEDVIYFTLSALNLFPLFLLILSSSFEICINRKNKIAWCGLFSGIILFIMLLKLRTYRHYSFIIIPMLPLIFVILSNAVKDFICRIKQIWQIRGISLKRMTCKLFLPIFILPLLFYSGFCFKFYLSGFLAPFSSGMKDSVLNYLKTSASIHNLLKIIPEAERNSLVTWGVSSEISVWVLETNIKPRNRFFYNQSHFTVLDPAVKKEWFDEVTKDYPLWIIYGGKLEEKALGIFIPPEDSDVEKLLAEKYVFKGGVKLSLQTLKLYRLKDT